MRRVFAVWRLDCQSLKLDRTKRIVRALDSWEQYVDARRFKRIQNNSASQKALVSLMKRWFGKWRSETQDRVLKQTIFVQKQEAIRTAIEWGDRHLRQQQRQTTMRIFVAWRAFVNRRAQKAAALDRAWQHYACSITQSTFDEWKTLKRDTAMWRHEQERAAEQHFRHRLAISSLCAWADYTRAQFRKRIALENVLEKTWHRKATNSKREMVAAWKLRTRLSRNRRIQADLMFRTRTNAILQVHSSLPPSTLPSDNLVTGHPLDVGELYKSYAE